MTLERKRQIWALYDAAAEQSHEQRGVFLAQACAGDTELQGEVEKLLAADTTAEEFLTTLTAEEAAEFPGAIPDPYQMAGRVTIDDKYRVDALIGQGGMGAVYHAHQLGVERSVALKILLPHSSEAAPAYDPQAVARFVREAQMMGRFQHPNIVQVIDVGETSIEGRTFYYLVMEWIPGPTLAAVLKEAGALNLDRTANLLHQIAAALSTVHQHKMIHRDLKPSNIMLVAGNDGTEQVKVVDFGIARIHRGLGSTTTTANLATPSYASPEQLLGQQLDERSDIYSLGLILYEMLAGALPFRCTALEQANAALPSLCQQRPEIPLAVEQLVFRMLAVNPEQRPQANEIPSLFAQALQRGAQASASAAASLSQPAPNVATAPSTLLTEDHTPSKSLPARRKGRTYFILALVSLSLMGLGKWGYDFNQNLKRMKETLEKNQIEIDGIKKQVRFIVPAGSGLSCESPPQQPQFNIYPLTFAETANKCEDYPLLRLRDVQKDNYPKNEAEMNAGITAKAGDVLYVTMYVHNGASEALPHAQTTAKNTKLTTTVSSETGTTHTIRALVSADNAIDAVDQFYKVTTGPNDSLEVIPNSGERFDSAGNLNEAGFALGDNTVSLSDFRAGVAQSRFYRFQVKVVNKSIAASNSSPLLTKEVRNLSTHGTEMV